MKREPRRRPPRGPVSWHGVDCPRCGVVFHFVWTARWHNRRCSIEHAVINGGRFT